MQQSSLQQDGSSNSVVFQSGPRGQQGPTCGHQGDGDDVAAAAPLGAAAAAARRQLRRLLRNHRLRHQLARPIKSAPNQRRVDVLDSETSVMFENDNSMQHLT